MRSIKIISSCLFLFLFFNTHTEAQEKLLEVHHEFWQRPWLDRHPHELWGYRVTMMFGEKYAQDRYSNVRQTTGMGYQDLDATIDSLRQQANMERWPADSLENRMKWYLEHAPGGRIFIFIARYDEDAADTRFMYMAVNGPDDRTQLLRTELPYQAPELPEGYGWWNYIEVPVATELPYVFHAYLKRTTQVNPVAGFRFENLE